MASNRKVLKRLEALEAEVANLRKQVYTALSGLAPKPRTATSTSKPKTD